MKLKLDLESDASDWPWFILLGLIIGGCGTLAYLAMTGAA